MGTVVSKAANGIGVILGNAFTAPIKAVFGASCEGVCAGTWDLPCFIEHLCVSNIVKLVMVFILTYITLLFLYLLFKLGLIQCILKSLCKMGWAACETYWYAMEDITCFLWHKLKNTKRVHRRPRRRFKDVERGYSSSEDDVTDHYDSVNVTRRRRSFRERRKERMQSHGTKHHTSHGGHHHDVRLKRAGLSVHSKGGSARTRNPGKLQVRRVGSFKLSKRRIKKR